MHYPGNESVSEEIRERILETFRQTLDLAGKGNRPEARLGCDFVLRLDPLFEPARTLQERLEGDGAIEIGDLQSAFSATEGEDLLDTPDGLLDSDQPPSPIEDTPAQPAGATVAPGASEEPEAALDSETERRISELLQDGQAEFQKVDYQAAIDAWSRIFLIDIDHAEANRRIELARKLKAEVERKVEEALHEGITHLELGAPEDARAAFQKILSMQPGHRQAQEYLEKIDAGEAEIETVEPPPAPEGADARVTPPSATAEEAPPPVRQKPLPRKPRQPQRPQVKPKPDQRRRLFLIIGTAVLLLVVVGGWLLFSNWGRMFPNTAKPVAVAPRPDPIARAQTLHADGRTSVAVAQLRRLPPDDPSYAEAQALIAEWETPVEEETTGPSTDQLAERERLLEDAERAYDSQEYLRADRFFSRVAAISPLEGAAAASHLDVQQRLAPIQAQIEVVRQGEWEYALRDLWRLHQATPGDKAISSLMVDCYYNLGVRDLQRGDTLSAEKQFKEALELAPGDSEVSRLVAFSRTYQSKPEDLLYRIFVKYLHFR